MRLALWTSLPLRSAQAVVLAIVTRSLRAPGEPLLQALSTALGVVDLVAGMALAVGLWRFGDLPPSTGAARPARTAFALLVGMLAVTWLSTWLLRPLLSSGELPIGTITSIFLLRTVVAIVLHGAFLGALVSALGASLRFAGERLPRWATALAIAFVAWRLASVPVQTAVRMLFNDTLTPVWTAATIAAEVAFTAALASLLRRAELALARQESPESA
jgi:hypothetical protein